MKKTAVTVLAAAALLASAIPAGAQSWRTEAKSRGYRGQDFLDVRITYAVGRLDLHSAPDHLLYRIDTRYDEDVFRMRSDYLESGGRGSLRIEIESIEDDLDLDEWDDRDYEAGRLEVGLPQHTPVALNLKLGAAEARLDLGGLTLERISYETGASETEIGFSEPNRQVAEYCSFKIAAAALRLNDLGNSRCERINVSGGVGDLKLDFSGDWTHDASADVNVGLGGVEIRVPDDIGVRIEKSTFLMKFDAPGFLEEDGGVYLSRNWDDAEHRLTITISGALGGIRVARI
ncbi:MAG: cell wall-active antibiotics response protein [Gemmatimonadetes bacterium]|uniref:Cell wall-active antibiotics response protein n=1 Tax=Candidatus Kutchimonas denitrificans TaxID=3056748 RepID=A0AAE4ZAK2_9BACT|nr:cell wall-active antibiotics response protein [Gemmatimonadota bacterium]NIR75592.1 cell wall-active antibiotics response protein [Candidatus Kutchimonas denitrificans]NIS01906.1 cell wall-active antibiotics response protein [Gemmatimonadota bacterium]NIT67687.1 cell wall-active antibiotics response protein [Gemmatimonadota bacterium]NIU53561.1 hypothetical protein [Gemmatimonadota bacterium]